MLRSRLAVLLSITFLAIFLIGRLTAPPVRSDGRRAPAAPPSPGCPYELACPYCRGRTAFDADPTHADNPFENVGLEPREEWERGWQSGQRHRQRLQADE
jgi:hypothetical protein